MNSGMEYVVYWLLFHSIMTTFVLIILGLAITCMQSNQAKVLDDIRSWLEGVIQREINEKLEEKEQENVS